jgi:uracil-DNA glycosylase
MEVELLSGKNDVATAQEIISTCQDIGLEPGWKSRLAAELTKPYMQQLKQFLAAEKAKQQIIYPKGSEIFAAFNLTPFEKVKVVILGQDPYHGVNQAHGLCFSVKPGIKPPPSLVNIYKELQQDVGFTPVKHGFLSEWAAQGVLLLNSVLTVAAASPGSHQGKGWEEFTDAAIAGLNARDTPVVFLLWGSYAHKKGELIDTDKHFVLKAAHPSPFSAYRGFLGCKHFSKANECLLAVGQQPINWQLAAP